MQIGESWLPELDQEMTGTRRTLERVPADKFGWKPHPKSGSMLWLARHLLDRDQLGGFSSPPDAPRA